MNSLYYNVLSIALKREKVRLISGDHHHHHHLGASDDEFVSNYKSFEFLDKEMKLFPGFQFWVYLDTEK